ncbi:MAG: GNAT family N-acetyltransferase [Anaerolineaceae bacterium]|nr:GNAT family N-acetyltransferase [Anaerolineaceae bacterium]
MLHFRQATKKDARAIRGLIFRVGINPISLDWQRFLLVMNEKDQIIGCGQIKPHSDGTRELASIAVIPEFQGRGIGTEIITRLMENEPLPVYLTCRSILGSYYQQFGFQRVSPSELPPYFRRISHVAYWINRFIPRTGQMWVMVKR